ncbi:MAG: stress response translation initiation inhibitor YciH [Candidatus Aenigmarchaeota archaeon]|nr:stress response translation initiation inhibitor YciH [Candidatus Aenigmarchaeota archaeon]
MEEICSKCGLPKSLCVCKAIEKEVQKIRVFLEKRRFGKQATIIEGISEGGKEVASRLKQKLACGGTIKEGHIELQGDHRAKIKDVLIKLGYSEEQIEIS